MGILGRFDRRKARDRIRLNHHPLISKYRPPTRTQSVATPSRSCKPPHIKPFLSPEIPPVNLQHDDNLRISKNGRLRQKIDIDNGTATIIQNEVMDILQSSSGHSCTALEVANALAKSQACLESHSKLNEKRHGFFSNVFSRKPRASYPKTKISRSKSSEKLSLKFSVRSGVFSRKIEKESMRSRYEWVQALNRLEKSPASRDTIIFSWKEAREILEDVICFPSALFHSEEISGDHHVDSSRMEYISSIEKERQENLKTKIETVQKNVDALSLSKVKWKQIASYPDHHVSSTEGKELDKREEEDLETLIKKESIDKADLYFNARIRTKEELTKALRENEVVQKLEERRKAKEARKRASSLMRTLNNDERKIVETSINGYGHDDEIIAQAGTDSVQRKSMKTLKPGMWLNDEIIHYFYLMLSKRDEELCRNDPSRKRSHFFKSFFITKLLNEGNTSCDGKYEYRNVKRWSKKVPGKDIFDLDKILFPINMGNMHWICAAIFMKKKRIEIFDSMGSDGNRYLDALFNYIQDEHMDKKKKILPDADAWELVPTQRGTPRQTNGHDCGVFTCMFADFLSKDTALLFNQDHIDQCRERIALSIMKGKAIM